MKRYNMKNRTMENQTRMTINGKRYRVGNQNHPYHELYKERGIEAVYQAMGLVEAGIVEASKPKPTLLSAATMVVSVWATLFCLTLLGVYILSGG
jgi:hypothetical protein